MRYRLRFDGRCDDNGGPGVFAAYGWEVCDLATGSPVARGSGAVDGPVHTNNVAEYEGLVAALHWLSCLAVPPEYLLVEGDSQLVVNTVSLAWKCKKPHLAALRDAARRLLAEIGCEWEAAWIAREANEAADGLSRVPARR